MLEGGGRLTPDCQSLVDLCDIDPIPDFDELAFRRIWPPEGIPPKHRTPFGANVNPPILLQPLEHLPTRADTGFARVVVDVDALAAYTVVCHDHLRLVVDFDGAPVVFLPGVVGALDDDIRAELDHVHLLAVEARGDVVERGLGRDEEGRAILKFDPRLLALTDAHESFDFTAEEGDVLLEEGRYGVRCERLHIFEYDGALVVVADIHEYDVVAEAFGEPFTILLTHVEGIRGAAVHVHMESLELLSVRNKRNPDSLGFIRITIRTVGDLDGGVVCAIVFKLLDELRHVREVTNGHVLPSSVIFLLQKHEGPCEC